MTGPVTRHRDIESLKTAACWPGADRATTVTLATRLAAARADAEGYRYFCELAGARPGEALPLAQPGLLCHPASITLAGLRRTALHRLMEACQQSDPFRFLIAAGLAAAETAPVQ